MSDESKLKILLLGPVSSGKSAIANFLSNSSENFAGEYRPTKGVRILEFAVQGVKSKGGFIKNSVDVELWDCSGDNRYQSCWPAMLHKADGIIFVYKNGSNHEKTSLETLHGFFVEEPNFSESCCLILKNEFESENSGKSYGNPLSTLSHLNVNLDERGGEFRKNFHSFISGVIKTNSND